MRDLACPSVKLFAPATGAAGLLALGDLTAGVWAKAMVLEKTKAMIGVRRRMSISSLLGHVSMRRDQKRSKLSRIQTIIGIVPVPAQQSRQIPSRLGAKLREAQERVRYSA